MSSPIRALLEVANVKRSGDPVDFRVSDAMMVNVTLGIYQREGIEAAVLRIIDMDTQHPIRFNPDNGMGGVLEILDSMNDGKLFLYFDKYELVALVEVTFETRFFILHRPMYKAYMATPHTPILESELEKDLSKALGWVERRVQKCDEIFPKLTAGAKVD